MNLFFIKKYLTYAPRQSFPLFIIASILLSVSSIGCLTIDDSAEQERAFRHVVDTLYRRKIEDFNKELDSICSTQIDSLIQLNIDSIRKVRLKEIEKLVNK